MVGNNYVLISKAKETKMSRFAVIDTETTWGDAVMSIGTVVAESETFELIDKRYYILTPFKNHGGMYTYALCPMRNCIE